MPFWRVDVRLTQETTIYIEADTQELAMEDAEELSYELAPGDWEYERDLDILSIESVPTKAFYWTGGESGHYEFASNYPS